MPIATPPTLTDPGLSPDRSDPATFSARAIALDEFTKNVQIPQLRLALANVSANATDAATTATNSSNSATSSANSATNAATQVTLAANQVTLAANQVALATTEKNAAASSAQTAAQSAALPGWVTGTNYATGQRAISLISGRAYLSLSAGVSTIDPLNDTSRWRLITANRPVVLVTTTTQTASAGSHYVMTNPALTSLTLPASPVTGDEVEITFANGRIDNLVLRNGKGLLVNNDGSIVLEDLVFDSPNSTLTLAYAENAWRFKTEGSGLAISDSAGATAIAIRNAEEATALALRNSTEATALATRNSAANVSAVQIVQTDINNKYRGALATDPATRTDGSANVTGDEVFNTTAGLLKRWNGAAWQASDINTSNLAATSGSSLVGFDGGTVQSVMDDAKPMPSYSALRAYSGRATGVRITSAGVAGLFQRDNADVSSLDNGGTVIVDASSRRWKRLNVGDVNVLWFGAIGNGVADDTAAENAALLFCSVSANKTLYYSAGTYLRTAAYAFTAAYAGIKLQGAGKGLAIVKMGYAGNLGTVVTCPHLSASGIVFDGSCATYPANKGFVFSGASNFPEFDDTVLFSQFADSAIEFGADSGFRAKVSPIIFTTGVSDYRAIHCTGTDTTAMFRDLSRLSANGSVQLTGTLDTEFVGGFCTRVLISSTASITKVIGVVWGSGAVPIVIDGQNTLVIGCRLAQAVTLNAGMSGSFVGNVQTVVGFTDNTVIGNTLVLHHPPAADFELYGKHKIGVSTPTAEFQLNVLQSMGDVDYAWSVAARSPSFVTAGTSLTANRSMTLSTTGARPGMTLRVIRNGGNTGGPWTLAIGSTGKSLSTLQWCDVFYNGSFWLVTASGTL